MLNNFVNHMVHISQSEASKRGLDWAILQPLLEKTCDSIIRYKALEIKQVQHEEVIKVFLTCMKIC
jgi:hypothetical protein